MLQRTVAIIPARGGSRALPHKNRLRVGGRTLVARAIDAARRSGSCDVIAVSTDDPAIAREAEGLGAAVVHRPPRLAGPRVATPPVITHAIDMLKRDGQTFDRVVVLQPTSPLRLPADVRGAVQLHNRSRGRNVIGIVEVKGVTWAMRLGKDHRVRPLNAVALTRRRQDLPRLYLPNGALYVLAVERVALPWFTKAVGYVMPRDRSIDIDDSFDLRIARALATRR